MLIMRNTGVQSTVPLFAAATQISTPDSSPRQRATARFIDVVIAMVWPSLATLQHTSPGTEKNCLSRTAMTRSNSYYRHPTSPVLVGAETEHALTLRKSCIFQREARPKVGQGVLVWLSGTVSYTVSFQSEMPHGERAMVKGQTEKCGTPLGKQVACSDGEAGKKTVGGLSD
ncbi:hypothetical protein BKA81DRAFT_36104 [Phyllosticta paracitricarpa]